MSFEIVLATPHTCKIRYNDHIVIRFRGHRVKGATLSIELHSWYDEGKQVKDVSHKPPPIPKHDFRQLFAVARDRMQRALDKQEKLKIQPDLFK